MHGDRHKNIALGRGNNLYRIKCVTEAFERVVPEAQLAERA